MLNRDKRMGWMLLLPALIVLAGLIIYPFINALWLSFQNQMIYQIQGKWVGLSNYTRILKDPAFWKSTRLSIVWTLGNVAGQVLLGVGISLLLNQKFRGRTIARGLTLLPFFMPTVAMMLMWRWMLNENYGILNHLLTSLHLIDAPIGWLSSTGYAFITVIVISIWRYTPFVVINILSRLQTIPLELYEAADLDGASKWQSFRYVTLPEIRDVLQIVIVLRVIFMFKKVDEIMLLTNGGPGTATTVLPLYTYKNSFESMQMGRGAASAMILMVFLSLLIALYFHFMDDDKEEV